MRLLEKKEIQESKRIEQDLINTGQVIKEVKKDYTAERDKALEEYKKFVSEISDRKSALLSEVSTLEERKRRAIEPLQNIKDTLDLKENELITKESDLIKREGKIELGLVDLREQEKMLNKRENQISKLDYEVETRRQTLEKGEKSLNDRIKDFEELKEKESVDLARKEMEIIEKESDLSVRERELSIKTEQLEKEKETLNKEKQHIKSQQMSLKAAFAELKKQ